MTLDKKQDLVSSLSDTLKKTIATGVGVISGDDNLKDRITEMSFQKEVTAAIDKVKEDVLETVRTEIRRFLDRKDWQDQIREILKGTTIEVQATIKVEKDNKVSTVIKSETKETAETKSQAKTVKKPSAKP